MGWQAAPKIIPLTRKVGVKIYGFIFWLKRIFLGNFSTKNVLPIRRKHYRLAALLHDAFRKPHRQKVYLKPKYKAKTSRFLSTLRFLFGSSSWTRTTSVCNINSISPPKMTAHFIVLRHSSPRSLNPPPAAVAARFPASASGSQARWFTCICIKKEVSE